MKQDNQIFGFALVFYFLFIFFVAFTIGYEQAINKTLNIIETEMKVSTDQISLEDVRLQVLNLKVSN